MQCAWGIASWVDGELGWDGYGVPDVGTGL